MTNGVGRRAGRCRRVPRVAPLQVHCRLARGVEHVHSGIVVSAGQGVGVGCTHNRTIASWLGPFIVRCLVCDSRVPFARETERAVDGVGSLSVRHVRARRGRDAGGRAAFGGTGGSQRAILRAVLPRLAVGVHSAIPPSTSIAAVAAVVGNSNWR